MIKFWKSAAKGKSGCPVRPPEQSSSSGSNVANRNLLDLQAIEVEEDNHAFDKKSKLSFNLQDILHERKALKYFLLFMESISKEVMVRCWLELDNFRNLVSDLETNKDTQNLCKISRAKSFDLPDNNSYNTRQNDRWKKCKSLSISQAKHTKTDGAGSCMDLSEHSIAQTSSIDCTDPTEIAINLFKKYIALEAPYPLDLPDDLRKSVISNICQPHGKIDKNCFNQVQDIIFDRIKNNYYNNFMDSPFYIKAQLDILTNGSLRLQDILHNESILFYFTEYLEQESCRILLEYLIAVLNFRDNLLNGDPPSPEQAQQDAIVIYDKYFSLQATTPVGFPMDIRLKIESDICADGGTGPTCFDLPYKIVFRTLTRYVKTFLESELYYKYLSEMIHSVENMGSNHKTNSECSSEYSISTQNTLLAMGDPVFRRNRHNKSVPDMTIDSNQLYNADALWQRKKSEGLNLGRVNSLGRFESKFEPDPDKKDKSVLKKMVSKFVPHSSSKVEEEMAWQIAHMIVKDVTDLTMAPAEGEHYENESCS